MEAMQLEPNDVLVMYNYAVALYSNEKYLEAIVQLNRILKKKDKFYCIWSSWERPEMGNVY